VDVNEGVSATEGTGCWARGDLTEAGKNAIDE
jgi:hypothetical protein